MEHKLYDSIEEMLAPETLSALEGRVVTNVRCLPFHPSGFQSASSSHFLVVETNEGQGQRYLLKRISLEWDWVMRATADHLCRSVAIWQDGLLDRLSPEIAHEVIACAIDGPGWAILMRDVSPALIPPDNQLLSVADNERFLDAMAALHTTFWEAPDLTDPALGLCSPSHFFTLFSSETGCRESDAPHGIGRILVEGWDLLETLLEPDVRKVIYRLQENPQLLCNELGRYPQTLVHGDWRIANLGLMGEERKQVILLDWQFITMVPVAVDLAWYLSENLLHLPVSKEVAITTYRQALAQRLGSRFNERWWQPQLELSLLGGFFRAGCWITVRSMLGKNEARRAHWRADPGLVVGAGAGWSAVAVRSYGTSIVHQP